MPDVAEETGGPSIPSDALQRPDPAQLRPRLAVPSADDDDASLSQVSTRGFGRRLSVAGSMLRFPSFRTGVGAPSSLEAPTREEQYEQQYQDDMVDILDTVGMYLVIDESGEGGTADSQ